MMGLNVHDFEIESTGDAIEQTVVGREGWQTEYPSTYYNIGMIDRCRQYNIFAA